MSIAEKLTAIAENVPKVYRNGYLNGDEQGYYRGYQDGLNDPSAGGGGADPTPTQEKTVNIIKNGTVEVTPDEGCALSKVTANVEVPDFWDVLQDNGNRTDYEQCFNGPWWTQDRFKSIKHPIVIQRCNYMFQQSVITDVSVATIDFTQKTGSSYITRPFDQSGVVTIGEIDLSNIATLNTIFGYNNADDSYLETIQKLTLSETNTFGTNFFQNCVKLKNITIEGTIGNDLNMSACPLTTESVQSVITHLKDLTGQASKRLQLSSTVAANLTPAQTEMLAEKNWTT